MINRIKTILDINDDSVDEKLLIYLDFTIEYVKSYCSLSKIPKNLEIVTCMLTAKFYSDCENAQSLSLGDISMTFANNDSFLEYRDILNKYRKVGF